MEFNKDSGIVKLWVRLLTQESTTYMFADVPDIFNLRQVVLENI